MYSAIFKLLIDGWNDWLQILFHTDHAGEGDEHLPSVSFTEFPPPQISALRLSKFPCNSYGRILCYLHLIHYLHDDITKYVFVKK